VPGRRQHGRRAKHGADQAEIEQDRRGRRLPEFFQGVQNTGIEGHQRDEHQIGEGDAREDNRELKFFRRIGEARRQHTHDPGHADFGGDNHRAQGPKQNRQGAPREGFRFTPSVAFQLAREHGHEGGRKGALGEQAAEQVGQLEGDEKNVGAGAGAQHRGDQDIAQKTQNPADKGEAADGGDGTQKHHRRLNNGFLCRRKGGSLSPLDRRGLVLGLPGPAFGPF